MTLLPTFSLLLSLIVIALIFRVFAWRATMATGTLVLVFSFGSIAATLISLYLQGLLLPFMPIKVISFTAGPVFEEVAKLLPVILIAFFPLIVRRLSVADFALVGFVSGLGFQFVENNFSRSLSTDVFDGWNRMWGLGFNRYDGTNESIFWAGHYNHAALVALALGIGLKMWPANWRRFLPALVVLLLVIFDHQMSNYKLVESSYPVFTQAPLPLELLYRLTLNGLLFVIALPIAVVLAQMWETRELQSEARAQADKLLLPGEARATALGEIGRVLARFPFGRQAIGNLVEYFGGRRAVAIAEADAETQPSDAVASTFAGTARDAAVRRRDEVAAPHKTPWLPTWDELKGGIAYVVTRYRSRVMWSVVTILLFAVSPKLLPWLHGVLITGVLGLTSGAFVVWRLLKFRRAAVPEPAIAGGDALSVYRFRWSLLIASAAASALSLAGVILHAKGLIPGGFITGHLEQWTAAGGSTDALMAAGAALTSDIASPPDDELEEADDTGPDDYWDPAAAAAIIADSQLPGDDGKTEPSLEDELDATNASGDEDGKTGGRGSYNPFDNPDNLPMFDPGGDPVYAPDDIRNQPFGEDPPAPPPLADPVYPPSDIRNRPLGEDEDDGNPGPLPPAGDVHTLGPDDSPAAPVYPPGDIRNQPLGEDPPPDTSDPGLPPPVIAPKAAAPPDDGIPRTQERPGTGDPNAVQGSDAEDPNAQKPTYSEDREQALRQGMVAAAADPAPAPATSDAPQSPPLDPNDPRAILARAKAGDVDAQQQWAALMNSNQFQDALNKGTSTALNAVSPVFGAIYDQVGGLETLKEMANLDWAHEWNQTALAFGNKISSDVSSLLNTGSNTISGAQQLAGMSADEAIGTAKEVGHELYQGVADSKIVQQSGQLVAGYTAEEAIGQAKQLGGAIADTVTGAVSDPIGTAKSIGSSIAGAASDLSDSVSSALKNFWRSDPEEVRQNLANATVDAEKAVVANEVVGGVVGKVGDAVGGLVGGAAEEEQVVAKVGSELTQGEQGAAKVVESAPVEPPRPIEAPAPSAPEPKLPEPPSNVEPENVTQKYAPGESPAAAGEPAKPEAYEPKDPNVKVQDNFAGDDTGIHQPTTEVDPGDYNQLHEGQAKVLGAQNQLDDIASAEERVPGGKDAAVDQAYQQYQDGINKLNSGLQDPALRAQMSPEEIGEIQNAVNPDNRMSLDDFRQRAGLEPTGEGPGMTQQLQPSELPGEGARTGPGSTQQLQPSDLPGEGARTGPGSTQQLQPSDLPKPANIDPEGATQQFGPNEGPRTGPGSTQQLQPSDLPKPANIDPEGATQQFGPNEGPRTGPGSTQQLQPSDLPGEGARTGPGGTQQLQPSDLPGEGVRTGPGTTQQLHPSELPGGEGSAAVPESGGPQRLGWTEDPANPSLVHEAALPGQKPPTIDQLIDGHLDNTDWVHTTNQDALRGISENQQLDQGGRNWSSTDVGIARSGNVVIRVDPAAAANYTFEGAPFGATAKPPLGTSYIPAGDLQYFDPLEQQWKGIPPPGSIAPKLTVQEFNPLTDGD